MSENQIQASQPIEGSGPGGFSVGGPSRCGAARPRLRTIDTYTQLSSNHAQLVRSIDVKGDLRLAYTGENRQHLVFLEASNKGSVRAAGYVGDLRFGPGSRIARDLLATSADLRHLSLAETEIGGSITMRWLRPAGPWRNLRCVVGVAGGPPRWSLLTRTTSYETIQQIHGVVSVRSRRRADFSPTPTSSTLGPTPLAPFERAERRRVS